MVRELWHVRLAAAASGDVQHILQWTHEQFGMAQARTYATTISRALKDLRNGPLIAGARQREDIGAQIKTLHIARGGRKGRHILLFRPDSETRTIEVLRLLHESMDLARHLPD